MFVIFFKIEMNNKIIDMLKSFFVIRVIKFFERNVLFDVLVFLSLWYWL